MWHISLDIPNQHSISQDWENEFGSAWCLFFSSNSPNPFTGGDKSPPPSLMGTWEQRTRLRKHAYFNGAFFNLAVSKCIGLQFLTCPENISGVRDKRICSIVQQIWKTTGHKSSKTNPEILLLLSLLYVSVHRGLHEVVWYPSHH